VATPEQLQHWLVQQGLTPDEIDRFMEDCLEIWGLWVRPLGLTYDVEERSANETVEFLLRTRYARQQAAAKELEMALAQGLLV
jgi:hypothetical protein